MNNNQASGHRALLALACGALSIAISPSAAAGEPTPGSLLLFPEYESQIATQYLLTVTNVDPVQDVRIMYVYIDGRFCNEFNRTQDLTPNDTLTVLVNFHNPQPGEGYLYVHAVNDLNEPIVFEGLIGTSTRIDGLSLFDYTVDPVVFHAPGEAGSLTDLDSDGVLDLDGTEYSQVPDELLIPRFLGQGGPAAIESELVLLNLTGGTGFDAIVGFLVNNDNEEIYSTEYQFSCWTKVPLLDISALFDQDFLADFTNQDPTEVLGAPQIESGWMRIDGVVAVSPKRVIEDPALLGFLIESNTGGSSSAAELPFGIGSQPNGALLEFGFAGKASGPGANFERSH